VVRLNRFPVPSETDSVTVSAESLAAALAACLAAWENPLGQEFKGRERSGMPVWKRAGLMELMDRGAGRRDLV